METRTNFPIERSNWQVRKHTKRTNRKIASHEIENKCVIKILSPDNIYPCRSMFYTSLGRLLMVDLGEDEDKFEAFMIPLTNAFESLGQVSLSLN